jgi:hypothetical protein
MLYTKDIDYYMDYLQEQDEIMCRKLHGRKPSLFYNIGFITFDTKNNPKCTTTTPRSVDPLVTVDGQTVYNQTHTERQNHSDVP